MSTKHKKISISLFMKRSKGEVKAANNGEKKKGISQELNHNIKYSIAILFSIKSSLEFSKICCVMEKRKMDKCKY